MSSVLSVGLVWAGDVCGELVEVSLRLGLELVKRALLLCSGRKKRERKSGNGREAHISDCWSPIWEEEKGQFVKEQAVVFLGDYDTTDKLIEQVAEMGGGQMSKERQVQ